MEKVRTRRYYTRKKICGEGMRMNEIKQRIEIRTNAIERGERRERRERERERERERGDGERNFFLNEKAKKETERKIAGVRVRKKNEKI